MNNENTQSTFVTVLAWLFIVGSGFLTFMTLMQNIFMHLIFKSEPFNGVFKQADMQGGSPIGMDFMTWGFQYILLAVFILSVISLAASICLLKRKNWARIFFIVLLVFGIMWNIFSLGIASFIFGTMPVFDDEALSGFSRAMSLMRIFVLLLAVGSSILFGWIIYRLNTQNIIREFKPVESPGIDETVPE